MVINTFLKDYKVNNMTLLCEWDFKGKGGQDRILPSSSAEGVSGTTAVGSGLLQFNYLGNGLTGRKQTKRTLSEALGANAYIAFTISPKNGYALTVTKVKIRPVSQNRKRTFALFSNQKSFSADNAIKIFNGEGIFQEILEIPIVGITNISSSLEFRLYIYGHTDEWESVGLGERQVGINACDLIVEGEVRNSRRGRPDREAPSVPGGLTASSITPTGFSFSWQASSDNVGVVSYEVLLNGSSSTTVQHPRTSVTLSGLTAGTRYSVTVRARDAAGNVSSASPALNVTTLTRNDPHPDPGTGGGGGGGSFPNDRSRMGLNLSSVHEYSSEQPFKDLFKTVRPWNDGNIGPMSLDANGWITALNGVPRARAYVMICDAPGQVYEMGQYVLLYEGSGTISFEGPGVSLVRSAPGRMVYNVSPQPGNRWIDITAVTPGNHIRNIRLLPIIYESDYQTNPWRPYVLNLWNRFKVIRFMDWMFTNNSTQTTWQQRTPTSWYTYNDRSGIPLELIVDLCNRLHTDAWICVPHQADDTYVAQMARLLRNGLAPDVRVYVEYSNECWNYIFQQAHYCSSQSRSVYPNISNDYERHIRWYSRRCVQVYDIFEREFGGTRRLIRVLGGQQGNEWALQVMFEHENARNKVDAFAIAPYFGHEYACEKYRNVISWTLSQFFNDIRTVSLPLAWNGVQRCINYARSVNKPMLAYEGGQHFTGGFCNGVDTMDSTELNRRFVDANLSPEMEQIYTLDLNRWRDMGGDMYCAFASLSEYTKWGCWGILRYPLQNLAAAPKYQAIINWIANNLR
jgi:hypothetical protein